MTTPPFLWGFGSAAYQIEGSTNAGGRGESIWDQYSRKLGQPDNDNASIACNSFNQYNDDVAVIKEINANSYRFSISWSRIFPTGKAYDDLGNPISPNPVGVAYYTNVIDALLSNNITPIITLFHWDTPATLQAQYNGMICGTIEQDQSNPVYHPYYYKDTDVPMIAKDFADYADFCINQWGNKVKHWCSINEASTVMTVGYIWNSHAPAQGRSTGPPDASGNYPINGSSIDGREYIVGMNLLLCHAEASLRYKAYYLKNGGLNDTYYGMVNNSDWASPYSQNQLDINAAERRNIFWPGFFTDPLFFGDFSDVLKNFAGNFLRPLTENQKFKLQGSSNIVYINNYTATYAQNAAAWNKGWNIDQCNNTTQIFTDNSGNQQYIGKQTGSSWNFDQPEGIHRLLYWYQYRYSGGGTFYGGTKKTGMKIRKGSTLVNGVFTLGNIDVPIPLIITENGLSVKGTNLNTPYIDPNHPYDPAYSCKADTPRIDWYNGYLTKIGESIKDTGIDLMGYMAWSLCDNYEWNQALNERFGLVFVDNQNYTSQDNKYRNRYLKDSAVWFRNYINSNPEGPMQPNYITDYYFGTVNPYVTDASGNTKDGSKATGTQGVINDPVPSPPPGNYFYVYSKIVPTGEILPPA
jgi:beta-glucosidase